MLADHIPKTIFDDLMRVEKTIPAYQRDFVWDTDDVVSFIENLLEAFEEKNKSYFCGSMVLYKNKDDRYEIVDGQQRTSVIFILLANLINSLPDDQYKFAHKQNYIVIMRKKGDNSYKFWHKNPEIMKFIQGVSEGSLNRDVVLDHSNALKSLNACYDEVQDFIDRNFKGNDDKIDEFIGFVTEKCFVVHYTATDMADALVTYSRLNSGGKKLGHLEVLKGLIYASAEKLSMNWDNLESQWDLFWSHLTIPQKIGSHIKASTKELIDQESFLAYFLLTYFSDDVNSYFNRSDGFPPVKKITGFLQSDIAKTQIFHDPAELLRKLLECSERVIEIRTGSHNNSVIENYYRDIALLSQSQTQPLIFILGFAENDYLLEELLGAVFNLTFIFTTAVTGTGSTSATWKSLAKKMRDLRSQNNDIEVAIKMKAELQEKINLFYKKEFSEYLLKMDIFGNTQKLKKTLRMLEIILRQNANISELSQYSKLYIKGGVDIDHIHPKNSADENAEYTNMIGNAALLKALINRSLQDKPFDSDVKQKAYNRSDYLSTNAIVMDADEAHGAEKNAVKQISTVTYMNDEKIFERSQELERIFYNYLVGDK